MSQLDLSDSFEYLCYGSTAIINISYSYSAGIDFKSTESDFYRRQILRTKVDPRTARVKAGIAVRISSFK